jgi:hypothetical protein
MSFYHKTRFHVLLITWPALNLKDCEWIVRATTKKNETIIWSSETQNFVQVENNKLVRAHITQQWELIYGYRFISDSQLFSLLHGSDVSLEAHNAKHIRKGTYL